jgi:maltodextrin utilization protein YvdJ
VEGVISFLLTQNLHRGAMPLLFYKYSRIIHFRKFMKSLTLTVNNIAPFFVAAVVSASTAFIGFGFYHGTFHMNANQAHCHQDGVCHNH